MRNANAASDVGEDRAGRVHQVCLKLRRAMMLQVRAVAWVCQAPEYSSGILQNTGHASLACARATASMML